MKKTIKELQNDLSEIQNEISTLYSGLGNKLLFDATGNTSGKNLVSSDAMTKWQSLRDERADSTNTILEIKSNISRASELDKFKQEAKDSTQKASKKIEKIKPIFLYAIYKDFFTECPILFSEVQSKLASLEEVINTATETINSLEADKSTANFFERINISAKATIQKTKIKKAEKNIVRILSEKITDIQNSDEVKKLANKNILNEELKTQFNEICALYNSSIDSNNRIKMIDEEIEFVNKKLVSLNANKNSKKTINEISLKIKNIDANIDDLTLTEGKNYANTLLDEQGNLLDAETASTYSDYINRIATQRKQITNINYKIEYNETLQKINEENIQIENAKRCIKNSEVVIKSAQQKIQEANITIENSQTEIQALTELSQEIFEKISEEPDGENE